MTPLHTLYWMKKYLRARRELRQLKREYREVQGYVIDIALLRQQMERR